MKKIITTLLIACMLISCLIVFASCNVKPALKDLEDVAETLEDEDYLVSYIDDEDELSPGMSETLYARSEDGDDSLSIIVFSDSKMAKLYYDELKAEYDYEIESIKREIKSIKHMLKKYGDELDSDQEDYYEDELKDLEKELKKMKEEYTFGRSGKTVWAGTADAAKDSKG